MCSESILLTFYGDDFSGSTDVMESLTLAGVRTVLFLQAPDPETLRRYAGVRAIGLAGVSRSMNRAEMDAELSAAFTALSRLGAPLVHYKICSTFDSSPEIGSIGRAIELGRETFASQIVPVVVGAPVLSRYCAFGNLFARSGLDSPVYRLDRHPTMSRHPITPMNESDLTLLLARQTTLRIGLIDLVTINQGPAAVRSALNRLVGDGCHIALFDTTADSQLATIGESLSIGLDTTTRDGSQAGFVVGSSGVEYALRAYWQQSNAVPVVFTEHRLAPVKQVVCVSGSCSPVTARQIAYACEHGFVDLAVDPLPLFDPATRDDALGKQIERTVAQVHAGKSVIVHTSCGPEDSRIGRVNRHLRTGDPAFGTAKILGTALGEILRQVVDRTRITRAVVTGGDTSGYVARQLGVEAFELVAPVAPGSPLCRVHARSDDLLCDGLQIAFKGGQVGHADYLVRVRDGSMT